MKKGVVTVTRTKRSNHATPMFADKHWLPV